MSACNQLNTFIVKHGGTTDAGAFHVGCFPLTITAFGIQAGDCVSFKRVFTDVVKGSWTTSPTACQVPLKPDSPFIADAIDYQIGSKSPKLNTCQNSIVIDEAGIYLPIVTGSNAGLIRIIATENASIGVVTDEMRGLNYTECDCSPCVDTTWKWTGNERCDGENVEREKISNCGNVDWFFERPVTWTFTGVTQCLEHTVQHQEINDCGKIRWTATTEKCGYSPSVPIVTGGECCGESVIGYMFDPNETIDPDASVALSDCDAVVHGYVYPSAGDGHTVEIKDCDGIVYGYAANQSNTAPILSNCD